MGDHSAPTLVRVWNGFHDEVASAFVEWDENGGFELLVNDPLAKLLFNSAHLGDLRLTVYSTEELLWSVHQYHRDRYSVRVHCIPFIDVLRHSLISDEYLVWLWLEAEKEREAS